MRLNSIDFFTKIMILYIDIYITNDYNKVVRDYNVKCNALQLYIDKGMKGNFQWLV